MATEPDKRRPASLALRVTLFVGIATTLVFIVYGWIVGRSLEHHFAELDAGELSVVSEAVRNALDDLPPRSDESAKSQRLAAAVTGHHGVFFHVSNEAGKRIYASHGPDLSGLAATVSPVSHIAPDVLQTWSENNKFYRGTVIKIGSSDPAAPEQYTVVVASSLDAHMHYIDDFEKSLWLTTVVVCGIALMASWLAVQQGHAPIRNISAQIRGITSSKLHLRLTPADVPIELAGLVESFNSMLGHIEDGFQQLSNFSADIAHELRTPVTNLITQTQVALSQPRPIDEYREVLYSNLEEFERMSKMIDDMLFLAKTENDLGNLALVEVDLSTEVKALFDYFEAWAEDRGVSLRLEEGRTDMIHGDQLMLRRALSNLLSNAIRHTSSGGCVVVKLASRDQGISICVENPGTEIDSEHLPRLFDRFYRVDPSRQRKGDGAGLGLAIVKSIVEAHHGTIRVSSAHGVNRFEITLPMT